MATGASQGAGIGGDANINLGNVTINGGSVTAIGGNNSAGIGASWLSNSGSITINGGSVTAIGGPATSVHSPEPGPGIGINSTSFVSQISLVMRGNAVVFTSSLHVSNTANVTSGILVVGNSTHTFHPSEFTLTQNATVPSGYRLTIANGKSLTVPLGVTLTNSGTIIEAENGATVIEGTLSGSKITTSFAEKNLSAVYGQTLEDVELPVTAKAGTFSWYLNDEQTPSDVSAGTVARPAAGLSLTFVGAHYNAAQVAVNLTVNKAEPPEIAAFPASATEIIYGQTLAESELEFESDDNGTFAWTAPNTVPTVAQSGTAFEVTYTPNDTANYDYSGVALTSMAAVTVNKADQTELAVIAVTGRKYGGNPFALETTGGSGTGAVTYELVSGSAATVTGEGLVTITGVGDIVVRAVKSADDNYNAAASEERTITIGKADQSALVVIAVTGKKYGDDPFELETTGGDGTGAVTYERVSGSAAIVSADGLVTIVAAGEIVVRAAKAADDYYNAATSTNRTITIVKADQSALVVTAVTGKKYGDDPFELETTGGDGTGAVTYERVSGSAAIVSADGFVTIVAAGEIVVRAAKAADDYYNAAASENVTITINNVSSITAHDRHVIPQVKPGEDATVIVPVSKLAAEFTAGPNPISKHSVEVKFFRHGSGINNASLYIYDAYGNRVNKINISDKSIGKSDRREVGRWDLKDSKGRAVAEGSYLVKGTITARDGKKEKISLILGVR
jgi:TfoX/Sxy family transcriptional regulator of competence genes